MCVHCVVTVVLGKQLNFKSAIKRNEIYFLLVLSKRPIKAKEHVITCKDYVIGRKITTILKIAVNTVTLELCDSRDYFASSLLIKKTD